MEYKNSNFLFARVFSRTYGLVGLSTDNVADKCTVTLLFYKVRRCR